MAEPLGLQCSYYPDDKQTKKAKKFGIGFTWTCPRCGQQLALQQGQGDYWFWQDVREL